MADERNITKAAERLHIPQPYLSNQIKQIEKELGTKLAERSTRKFQLTDAGKHFQYRASQIVNLMHTTEKELLEFEGGFIGSLRIGAGAPPGAFLLPKKLSAFHKMYPEVEIEVKTLRSAQVFEFLESDIIEIGLLRAPVDHKTFESVNLPSHPMVVVADSSYFDGLDINRLDLTFLENKPLIIIYRLEPAITEACRKAGFLPNYFCRIDDARTVLTCASYGMGITIVPRDWLKIVPSPNMSYFELDIPELSTSSALIWLRNRRLSFVAKNFLALYANERDADTTDFGES